jgi:hypothetical protein
MTYPGFRRRQRAWVLCRRAVWHSGFPQACWRLPTRALGRNQRRQIAHGLFPASGMVMLHGHHASARTFRGSDQNAWISFGKQGMVTSRKRRSGGSGLHSESDKIVSSSDAKPLVLNFFRHSASPFDRENLHPFSSSPRSPSERRSPKYTRPETTGDLACVKTGLASTSMCSPVGSGEHVNLG